MNCDFLKKRRNIIPTVIFIFLFSSVAIVKAHTKYQYWIDDDTENLISGEITRLQDKITLDLQKQQPGFHTVSFRVSDNGISWSAVRTANIIIPLQTSSPSNNLTYDFWIDDNSDLKTTKACDGQTFSFSLNTDTLTPGIHRVSTRISGDGSSTPPMTSYFVKLADDMKEVKGLTAYRWWSDGNPATTVSIPYTSIPNELSFSITPEPAPLTRENAVISGSNGNTPQFASLTPIHMQIRDEHGKWSVMDQVDTVNVIVPPIKCDLTGFITNPDASLGQTGWKWTGSLGKIIQDATHWTGKKIPYFCMGNPSSHGFTTTMTQTIDGLPAGVYILTAYGRANTEVDMRMSVGDEYVGFPAVGAQGGELWENATSEDPAYGLENGGGWSKRSLIFATDGNPFEIKVSGTTSESGQWFDISDFSLRLNCTGELNVSFAKGTDMSKFQNMLLRIEGDGRMMTQTVSENKDNYLFRGISPAYDYKISLVNKYGHTIASGKTNGHTEERSDVCLSDFKLLLSPFVTVVDSHTQTIIDGCSIEWYDSAGNMIATGDTLYRVPEGELLNCKATLPDKYGTTFREPSMISFRPTASSPSFTIHIEGIDQRPVYGEIRSDNGPIKGASVAVTEYVNNKYPNTHTATTDDNGVFSFGLRADSCRVSVMAKGYADHIRELKIIDNCLPPIALKRLSGADVSLMWTYKEATSNGPMETENRISLSDINVVAYNITTGRDSIPVHSQNGSLLISEVSPGDRIKLSLTSPSSIFAPTECSFIIKEDMTARCDAILVEQGRIEAQYISSQNKTDKAFLFDGSGKKVGSREYIVQQVTFEGLSAGPYTIMSFNSDLTTSDIPNLSIPTINGWTEGKDYILKSVEVVDGQVCSTTVGNIPQGTFKINHTGDRASLSARKSNLTVGNYLTLYGIVDFKDQYKDEVSDVSVVIDIPDGVEYIDNSAMVGNHINFAEISEGRLIIPIDNSEIGEQVKLCVMPMAAGQKSFTGRLEFKLSGTLLTEQLGCAGVEVANLKMSVPSTVNSEKTMVSGIAPANSHIILTDNGTIIADTKARSDGRWEITCRLSNPFHLTEHNIMAKATDLAGREYQTDVYTIVCDCSANDVRMVTMLNTAHNSQSLRTCEYNTEFNFEEPAKEAPVYWYWPNYPTFTFQTKYADNSPEKVKSSIIEVKTSDGNTRTIKSIYDAASDSWVGSGDFHSSALPMNVSVKTNHLYNIDELNSSELIVSAYAGTVISGNPFNDNQLDVRVTESAEGSSVIFDGVNGNHSVSTTMKTYGVESIPDKSTDGSSVIRMETEIDGNKTITLLYDEEKDNLKIYADESFAEIICSGLASLNGKLDETENTDDNLNKKLLEHEYELIKEHKDFLKENNVQVSEFENFFEFLEFLNTANSLSEDMNKTFNEYFSLINRYRQLKSCDEDLVPTAFVDACINDLKRSFDIYFKVKGMASFGDWASEKIKFKPLMAAVKITSKAGIIACNAGKDISKKAASNRLIAFEQACGLQNGNTKQSNCLDASHVMDPSGYVYEAVTSNRLQGVTATVYGLHKTEDIYGDIHETPQIWDASAYSQRNPVTTDENGVYAWDVPQGEWQVRFEKDGYEYASTGWLPVPPPQLEINIGMTQAVAPDAIEATAYENSIVVQFDKYMKPSSFSSETIRARIGSRWLKGKITTDNLEEDPYSGKAYASKMRLSLERPLAVGDSIEVIVGNAPLSYAEMEMPSERIFRIEVQPELKEIVVDSVISLQVGTSELIPVRVLPSKYAAGKRLRVSSQSPSITTSTHDTFTIDNNGIALVDINALLPGMGIVGLSIDGYDIGSMIRIYCELTDESCAATPVSSIVSGSSVESGTTITLSTRTPDAIIWFTTDGTCPCTNSSRMQYSSPIILTQDMVIKAQAVKEGIDPSEIAVFHYIVDDSGISSTSNSDTRVSTQNGHVEIFAPKGSSFEIYNIEGIIVTSGNIMYDSHSVDLQEGQIYFIHVNTQEGSHKTFKVIL